MFTDVEGSTRLWAEDSDAMSASLLVHDDIVRGVVEEHGGDVFSTAGDSFAASDAIAVSRLPVRSRRSARLGGPRLRRPQLERQLADPSSTPKQGISTTSTACSTTSNNSSRGPATG
jgi:class 3 adenylate cyclase